MSSMLHSTFGSGVYGFGLYGGTGLIPGEMIPGAGGGITVWYELWRATINNQMVEDITDILELTGGGVSLNHDRAITTQATFSVKDVARINPYTDFLAVFQNREYDDTGIVERDQLGLFTTPVPSGTRTIERAEGVYTGHDLTAILGRYAFTDTYNIAQGTNRVQAVIDIMAMAGITRYTIEPTDRTFDTPVTFEMGTTYLDACNTILEGIGYYYLTSTIDGKLTSVPSRDIRYTEPYTTITDDDLMREVQAQVTDTTVANIVIVIQDNFAEPPLTAVRRNDEPDSPTSTVSMGTKTRVETRSNLASQADVDALADRLLAEGRTFYQVAAVQTLPDPRVLNPRQTVDLDLTGKLAIFNGRWRVRTASIGFDPDQAGPIMEINRITDAITGALI